MKTLCAPDNLTCLLTRPLPPEVAEVMPLTTLVIVACIVGAAVVASLTFRGV